MQLTCNELKDFSAVWKDDFLGHKGFLLPGPSSYALGKAMQMEVMVKGEPWGKVEVIPVWQNLYGVESEATPKGIFLRLVKSDKCFEEHLAALPS